MKHSLFSLWTVLSLLPGRALRAPRAPQNERPISTSAKATVDDASDQTRRSLGEGGPDIHFANRSMHLYSALRLACCVLVVHAAAACSERARNQPGEFTKSIAASKALIEEYGALKGPSISAYLDSLTGRLVAAEANPARRTSRYEITILNTEASMAFSAGNGFIILSRGLVLSLGTEGELAFVVAHEMAHQELSHHPTGGDSEKPEVTEAAADSFALGLITRAGYEPRDAFNAIRRAANRRTDLLNDPQTAHILGFRLEHLQMTLQQSPPSVMPVPLPRRDFIHFQQTLARGFS